MFISHLIIGSKLPSDKPFSSQHQSTRTTSILSPGSIDPGLGMGSIPPPQPGPRSSAEFSPTFVGESRGIPLLFWRAEGPNPTFFPYFSGGPQARTLLFSPTFLEGWRPDPYFLRRYSWKFVRNSLILGAKNTSESSGSHRNSKIFACGAKLLKIICFRAYEINRGPCPTFSTLLFWRTEGPNPTFFPYFF